MQYCDNNSRDYYMITVAANIGRVQDDEYMRALFLGQRLSRLNTAAKAKATHAMQCGSGRCKKTHQVKVRFSSCAKAVFAEDRHHQPLHVV